jgi:Fe-S cluster biogenesis protein NfuA/nitrite reductase/ring-hydroxylating ferredoxin subunit
VSVARLETDLGDGVGDREPATEPLDARRVGERVGALLAEIGAHTDPRTTERTEDLVSLLMQFYGAGIRRMMEIADEAGVLEGNLLERFTADDLINGILIVHDLHPLDLETRVQDALDRVRPYLGSHGGDVEIVGIDGDVVRLRMEGSCSSCPSSTVTLNYAIEKAILEAAPEIARIEAEEVMPDASGPLIQLQPRHGAGPAPAETAPPRIEWMTLDPADRPGPSGLGVVELAGLNILLCRSGNDLYAYRDRCPNCRSLLEGGGLADALLTCPTCGHRFDVRLAGRSVGATTFHLEPLPLLSEEGAIRIAVPVPFVALPVDAFGGAATIASA